LATYALMEPVDASIIEARSTYLEGALEGPRSLYRADRSMDSSRRNPQSCMENSNTTDAGDPTLMRDPAAESMLLVAPNRSVDLEGLIGPLYRIDLWWKSIEFHGAVWRIILQCRRLEGLVGPVGLCC